MDKITYQQKKLEKEKERQRQRRTQILREKVGWTLFIIIGVVLAMVLTGYYFVNSQGNLQAQEIISRNGLHWHTQLRIFIDGKEQPIPANIGLGFVHKPIHTHEADNIVHLEFSGLVTKEDVKLKKFFEIWGKQFNKECIFEFCNGQGKQVKFFVNGQENQDFENYIMQDGDKIEIRYE